MEEDVAIARDLKTLKVCEQGREVNIGPKPLPYKHKYSSLYFLYSGVSTYVGLYGSGLFNFWSYVNLPDLVRILLGF